jgi:hypothetical protein
MQGEYRVDLLDEVGRNPNVDVLARSQRQRQREGDRDDGIFRRGYLVL